MNSKKEFALESVNTAALVALGAPETVVSVQRVHEAQVDAMWSYVGSKQQPRWLWQALDHRTGRVLAYVLVYNSSRPHRALDGRAPDAVYFEHLPLPIAA